ncbi:MAG: branched-chain amino acid ABC transporter substrate-binding protein [Anaerolineae bacterium]|nr:branched-chain amino acid ABC transporter substrate-binding protein [Anaerolineae bacterium]
MRRIIASLLLLILLATGCSAAPKGEITVYVAAPLSGFQANGGQTVVGGVRLAAEEINRSGGLLGYRVKIIALDDESDSDVALKVAERVRQAVQDGERVLGVIGHYNSGQTLAAMEVYKDLPIVVITPTASELSLTQRGYRNFFRVNANDAVQARVDATFLVKKLGAQRVAILHNDTEYGIGLSHLIEEELSRLGAEVVLTLQVAEGQSNYTTEVARVQAARPDAIFYAGYEIEAPYLRAALVRAGITVPMLASDGAFLSATIDESDGTAEGMYVSSFAPSPATAVDKRWIEAYQAVEYRNPDTYSINGYVAMTVLAEAARHAKSIEGPQVAEALHDVRVDTIIGPIRYDENGDVQDAQVFIFQVREGDFVQVQ